MKSNEDITCGLVSSAARVGITSQDESFTAVLSCFCFSDTPVQSVCFPPPETLVYVHMPRSITFVRSLLKYHFMNEVFSTNPVRREVPTTWSSLFLYFPHFSS